MDDAYAAGPAEAESQTDDYPEGVQAGSAAPVAARAPAETDSSPESTSALELLLRHVSPLPVLSRQQEQEKTRRLVALRAREHALIAGMPWTARALQRCLRSGRPRDLQTAWRGTPPDARTLAAIDRSLVQRLARMPSTTSRSRETRCAWDRFESRLRSYLESLGLRTDFYDGVFDELQSRYEGRRASRRSRARLREDVGFPLPRLDQRMRDLERARAVRDEARNEIARHNIKLVIRCAGKFRGLGLPFIDLIQEGTVGLLRAIELFEPSRGFKLSTYSVWWIRQSMVRAVQGHGRTVRLPSHVNDSLLKLGRAEEQLSQVSSGAPDETAFSDTAGLAASRVRMLRSVRQPAARLDARLRSDDDRTLLDVLPAGGANDAEETVDRRGRAELAERLLSQLEPGERRLVGRRFGLDGSDDAPPTLEALTREFGLSRESLRKREARALEKLRELAARELAGHDEPTDPDDAAPQRP